MSVTQTFTAAPREGRAHRARDRFPEELRMTTRKPEFTVLRDVPQTMRDGTVLRADVYLPQGKGPFPALLERTPYSKDNSPECQVGSPPFFASQGYAVVIQDVRGRFASEGRFIPFHDDGWGENRDGYDTVEWIAAQSWCDGNVGTIGGSYAGATQYRLAPTRPPHLRAMYVRESSADYWAEWVYHGGAFELGFMLEWTVRWTHNNLARLAPESRGARAAEGRAREGAGRAPELAPRAAAPPEPAGRGPGRLVQRLPGPSRATGPSGGAGTSTTATRTSRRRSSTWAAGSTSSSPARSRTSSGCGPRRGRQAARDAQRLVVGPWIHGPWNMAKSVQGEVDFGPEAIRDYNAIRVPVVRPLAPRARGTASPTSRAVQLFVMGENRWRTADDVSLARRRARPRGTSTRAAG